MELALCGERKMVTKKVNAMLESDEYYRRKTKQSGGLGWVELGPLLNFIC